MSFQAASPCIRVQQHATWMIDFWDFYGSVFPVFKLIVPQSLGHLWSEPEEQVEREKTAFLTDLSIYVCSSCLCPVTGLTALNEALV